MYYHTRPFRYVRYGRVEPPPVEDIDSDFMRAYEWLGRYCGFSPQIWLSRSRSAITGFRYRERGGRAPRHLDEHVLFGFEGIRGFPVEYDLWCRLLGPLVNAPDVDAADRAVSDYLDWVASEPDLRDAPEALLWAEHRALRPVLDRALFIERDQVVLPALNLKTAKTIVCRSDRQKKALRRLGFIEDRIQVRTPGSGG